MSTYQPQGKNTPINAETKGGDQLDQSRKQTREMDDKVTAIGRDLMRRSSGGGSQK